MLHGSFRRRQTCKSRITDVKHLSLTQGRFELLGLPLQGEHSGISAIQKSFQTWWDFLHEQHAADEESRRTINEIRHCFDSACTIYIRRATTCSSPSPSDSHYHNTQASTIRNLMQRLSHIPPDTHGAHALVWPCFVAGAEASDPEQRAFFVDYMNSIYARTQFRNIPIAVQSLGNLWRSKGEKRWTQCLPEISNVLVM